MQTTPGSQLSLKQERGRPKIEVPIEQARLEAADQIKRRDACEIERALRQHALYEIETFEPGSEGYVAVFNRYRRAQDTILELEAHGCASDGETLEHATIRILRRDGFGRRPVHRAVLGSEGGGETAAGRAGIEELEELKRIPERREFWGKFYNMPKWCRDDRLPDVKVRKLDGAIAQFRRGCTDLLASERRPRSPSA